MFGKTILGGCQKKWKSNSTLMRKKFWGLVKLFWVVAKKVKEQEFWDLCTIIYNCLPPGCHFIVNAAPVFSSDWENICKIAKQNSNFFFHRSGRWSWPEWGWRGWAGQRWHAECFSWELSSLKNNHLLYRYYIPGKFFSLQHFSDLIVKMIIVVIRNEREKITA